MPYVPDGPEKPAVIKGGDPNRVRKETGRDRPFGSSIVEAAIDADARILKSAKGPAPTDEEIAMIRGSSRLPATIGSHVTVMDLEDQEQETWQLVRAGEEDPASGRISIHSPMGRAFFQEYPGAVVEVKAPSGLRLCRILRVVE